MTDLEARRVVSSGRNPGDVDLGLGHVVVVLEDRQLLGVPEGHWTSHVPIKGEILKGLPKGIRTHASRVPEPSDSVLVPKCVLILV